MKKLLFGLFIAGIAFGGSAFKNIHKSIIFHFLVQRIAGTYSQSVNGVGTCIGVSTLPCRYSVTSTGLINIPNQLTYSSTDIASYISAGYLTSPTTNGNKIYVGN